MYGDLIREMQGVWGRWPGVNVFGELDQLMPNFAFPLTNRALNSMHYPLNVQPRIGAVPPLFLNQMVNFDYPTGYNCHSFMRQSVVSMSQGPDGRPQVYEETVSTTTAPGGIRETKQTVRDTRTGMRTMAIGHHIGERAHITARKQTVTSGEIEEQQEFINLDEDDADNFNREWEEAVTPLTTPAEVWNPPYSLYQNVEQLALPSTSDPKPSTSKGYEAEESTLVSTCASQLSTSKKYKDAFGEQIPDPQTSKPQPSTSDSKVQERNVIRDTEKIFKKVELRKLPPGEEEPSVKRMKRSRSESRESEEYLKPPTPDKTRQSLRLQPRTDKKKSPKKSKQSTSESPESDDNDD